MAAMQSVLTGLRIIETTGGIGVPYAGMLLASMGAEVIKVEKPRVGDAQRQRGPFAQWGPALERSLTFQYVNAGKKSVEIDLEKEVGQDALRKLLRLSNAWIRQGLPGYWDERGFTNDLLSPSCPALNVVSVNPFGDHGKYKEMHVNPFVMAHMSGETVLYPHGTGDEDKPPVILGGNFEEYDVGVVVAMGLLGALLHTVSSGEGQYLEVSEYEARVMCLMNETSPYPSTGMQLDREGLVQKLQASLSYKTEDGWVNPFLVQTKEFFNLAHVIGREEWIEEEWYQSEEGRRENYTKIRDAVQEWIIGYSTKEAVEILQQNRIPMGPVATPKDVVNDEHLRVRGYFAEIESNALGAFAFPGRPFVLEETPLQYSAAPILGSGNEEILGELLGFSHEAIQGISDRPTGCLKNAV